MEGEADEAEADADPDIPNKVLVKNVRNDFLPQLQIRNVHYNDLKEFVKAYRLSYKGLEEYAYTKNRQIKSYFKWMFSRDKDGFFVAETKNNIEGDQSLDSKAVGYIMVDTNWFSPFEMRRVGEIHELIVLPEFRKKGLGRMLISKAFDYMRQRGRRVAELWVGYRNYSAQKFYKKLGFEEKGSFGKWIRMTEELLGD